MTQESGTPLDFWGRIQKMIEDAVAKLARSGMLRNARISGGEGLTVGRGSKFQVEHPTGAQLLLAGIYDSSHTYDLGDGSYQPMLLLRRADGSLALSMYDPAPTVGGYQQFLAMWDRTGSIIISDDTDSGQGLARPYVPLDFYPARTQDWPVTTSGTFETMYRAKGPKQHPRLTVRAWGVNDTVGATGEMRLLVNGSPWGAVETTVFGSVSEKLWTGTVTGTHMSNVVVEIQARLASGAGSVQVGASQIHGIQS